MPQLALPAFWQGVTGALEPGETFCEAAVREVHEETSLLLPSVADVQFSHRFPIRPVWRDAYGEGPSEIEERVFCAAISEGTTPLLSEEHDDWRWCTFREAEQLLSFAANRECLRAVEIHCAGARTSVAMNYCPEFDVVAAALPMAPRFRS